MKKILISSIQEFTSLKKELENLCFKRANELMLIRGITLDYDYNNDNIEFDDDIVVVNFSEYFRGEKDHISYTLTYDEVNMDDTEWLNYLDIVKENYIKEKEEARKKKELEKQIAIDKERKRKETLYETLKKELGK